MDAEKAYLFRHALLRDCAYQLQMPSDRARLHALAFEIVESLHGGRAPDPPPLDDLNMVPVAHETDAVAGELAQHAASAIDSDPPRWIVARDHYLRRHAALCERGQGREAVEAWQDLVDRLDGERRSGAMAWAGYALWRVGRLKEAESVLSQARALAENGDLRRLSLLCLTGLVNVYKDSGKAGLAEETCLAALTQAQEIQDSARQCGLLGTLAMIYRQTGRVRLAEETIQEGLRLARTGSMTEREGLLLGNLAILHGETGQLDLAVEEMRSVLELAQKTGDRRMECTAFGNLANLLRGQKQHDAADRASFAALAIARELGDRRNEAIALRNLGASFAEQERYAEAEQFCQKALDLLRDIGDRRGQGIALAHLSLVHFHREQPQAALESIDQALAIHREVGNRRFEASALCHRALVLVGMRQIDEARKSWRAGASLLQELGDRVASESYTTQMRDICDAAGLPHLNA